VLLRHARCELGLSLHSILSPPDSAAQHSTEAGPCALNGAAASQQPGGEGGALLVKVSHRARTLQGGESAGGQAGRLAFRSGRRQQGGIWHWHQAVHALQPPLHQAAVAAHSAPPTQMCST
jgi:hypothetical protein